MSGNLLPFPIVGSYDAYKNYMWNANNFLEFGLPNIIEEKFSASSVLRFLVSCVKNFPLLSHERMLKRYFRTPKMRAMMSFQDLYVGLSPYEAPAIFSLLQALELSRGIYYPKGGFRSVANALRKIASANSVQVQENCEVMSVNFEDADSTCKVVYQNISNEMLTNVNAKKLVYNMVNNENISCIS